MITNKGSDKKKIMQVIPALVSGGVERGTLEIAKRVVESGYDSIVVSSGGPLVEDLVAQGSAHIQMNVASKNPIMIWLNGLRLAKIIKENKIDIIHARSRAPAWSCLIASKMTCIRLITTFHGIYNYNNFIKKYYNSIMIEGNPVIAVSNFVKKHIVENYGTDPQKVVVIHRGVNTNEFSSDKIKKEEVDKFISKYRIPEGAKILLMPSRMTKWKGHLVLIDALSKIKDNNFYCILAGDLSKHPNYVEQVKDKIKQHRLQSKVQMFGNEPNIAALYNIADIVISASIEPEAFGRTVIEAQAMGKIVIATMVGGATETIIDNETGFHVKANNSDSLAAKISYVLSIVGTEEYDRISENAKKSVVDNFSQEKMLSSVMSVYSAIK